MIGQDRNLGQDADAEADRDRSLDAREIRAGIGDMPRAAGDLGGVDHAIAIEAALVERGERQRIAAEFHGCSRLVTQCRRSGHAAIPPPLAGVALVQGEVELAALQRLTHLHAAAAAHVEAQPRRERAKSARSSVSR